MNLEKEVSKTGNLITKEKLLEMIRKSVNKSFSVAMEGKIAVVIIK